MEALVVARDGRFKERTWVGLLQWPMESAGWRQGAPPALGSSWCEVGIEDHGLA